MSSESEPGRERAAALAEFRQSLTELFAAVKDASPTKIAAMRAEVRKLTASMCQPDIRPASSVVAAPEKAVAKLVESALRPVSKTPEARYSPEVAFGKLVEIYNGMRDCTGEEQMARLRAELGPGAQIETKPGVVFVRKNDSSDWNALPNLGNPAVTVALKGWVRVPDMTSKEQDDGVVRMIKDFELEAPGSYPGDYDRPWEQAVGNGAMHKRLGSLKKTPRG